MKNDPELKTRITAVLILLAAMLIISGALLGLLERIRGMIRKR